jgi:hypothetical protein
MKCKKGYRQSGNRCIKRSRGNYKILGGDDSLVKIFSWITIIMISISALIGIYYVLFGELNETTLKILLSTLVLAGVGVLGWFGGYANNNLVKYSTIGLSAVSGIAWLLVVWESIQFGDYYKLILTFTILAVLFAHIALLGKARKSSDSIVRGLFWMVIVVAIIFSSMLIYLIVKGPEVVTELYGRLLIGFGVLDVAGSIIVLILRRVRQ